MIILTTNKYTFILLDHGHVLYVAVNIINFKNTGHHRLSCSSSYKY